MSLNEVQKLEQAVARLTPEALAEFRLWFTAFDAELWDAQIEDDAKSGKLDNLANQALKDFKEGRCRDL